MKGVALEHGEGSWDAEHNRLDWEGQGGLRDIFNVGKKHSDDFFDGQKERMIGAFHVVERAIRVAAGEGAGKMLDVGVDDGIGHETPEKAFRVGESVERVDGGLRFSWIAKKAGGGSKGHVGRGCATALVVWDNTDGGVVPDGDAAR